MFGGREVRKGGRRRSLGEEEGRLSQVFCYRERDGARALSLERRRKW